MKKITFLLAFIAFQFNHAQDTCATALPVTSGTTTVAAVDGTEVPMPECALNAANPDPRTAGEWYSYTATVDGIANVTTNIPANAGGDTRLHVYEGTCGALTCIGGNDDVDAGSGNYLSDSTFPVSMGATYIIAWDDRWSAAGFDFVLTETAVDCSTASPYSYDFASVDPFIACYTREDGNSDGTSWGYNNGNDVDGDMANDGLGIIFPPNPTVAKDEWLFSPVFSGVANADYNLTITYNAFDNPGVANESFDIVALDSPSSAATQTVLTTVNNVSQAGAGVADLLPNAYSTSVTYTPTTTGDFYFAIHATTPIADSAILMLFSIDVTETLSLDEFESNTFTHHYNKEFKTLNLESSSIVMTNIEIYSILGQNVISKPLSNASESINLSELNDGIYLAKVYMGGNSKTIKFVKN